MCNRLPNNMVTSIYIKYYGVECLVQSHPQEPTVEDEVSEVVLKA